MTNGFVSGIAHLADHSSFARRDLSSMRRGNLYPIMAPTIRPADPELRHNMLGMTEAGSVLLISGDESDQPEDRRGSFGKPAPGFETKIIEPDTDRRRRTVHPRSIRDAGVLQTQSRRMLRCRRLVPHR
jgi:acyl-CoA synthetase (AMP-forming)/AMP-acid ligase II